MKRNYIKWSIAMAICLLLSSVFCVGVLAIENQKAYGWYVKRNADHHQPAPEAEQKIIEKYNGYYIDKRLENNTQKKVLYLTFDAGYENGNVEKILDVLKEEQVPAAFFVLKNMLIKESTLVKRMVDEGHLVCNHTMSHKDTTKMSEEEFSAELDGLAALYKESTGLDMPMYYRPPEGKYNEKTLQYASKMGYKTVFWSMAYADWDNDHQIPPEKAKDILQKNTHNGAVVLLHPTSKTNTEILGDLIQQWKADGFTFGTLNDLTNG